MAKVDLGKVTNLPKIIKNEGVIYCYEQNGLRFYYGRHYVSVQQGNIVLPPEMEEGQTISVQATPSTSGNDYYCSAYTEPNKGIKYTLNRTPSSGGVNVFFHVVKRL